MTVLDHVAVVVSRLEAALLHLPHLADQAGPVEEFPAEGTREVYVGAGAGKLLLLEPTSGRGPYAAALAKRGPGLHHVAFDVADLDAFLEQVRGWLLHPKSVSTIAGSRTAWLARPGVPTLVEVHEGEPAQGEPLVIGVEVPAVLDGLVPAAGLSKSPDERVWLTVGGLRVAASALAGGER